MALNQSKKMGEATADIGTFTDTYDIKRTHMTYHTGRKLLHYSTP